MHKLRVYYKPKPTEGQGEPKVFEVGDILPATEQLRISWPQGINVGYSAGYLHIMTDGDNNYLAQIASMTFEEGPPAMGENKVYIIHSDYTIVWDKWEFPANPYRQPYTDENGNHAYIDIDTTSWSLAKRTVSRVDNHELFNTLTWADMRMPIEQPLVPLRPYFYRPAGGAPSPKVFEVGDVLPATTQLKIQINEIGWSAFGVSGLVKTDENAFTLFEISFGTPMNPVFTLIVNGVSASPSEDYSWTIDTSSWSLAKRTVSTAEGTETYQTAVRWQDMLNAGTPATMTPLTAYFNKEE